MNIDFHYYGTYVAARLAGYDFQAAQTIAHSAQYVDDSNMSMIFDNTNNKYYITDFKPVPTVQSTEELGGSNFLWNEESLNQTTRTWASFHFLPSNYGTNPGIQAYRGPGSDNGLIEYWQYDKESAEQFKLLCLPNNQLAKEMVNDIIQNHKGTDHEIHITGLRMHVLADTWAHTYYAAIPAWFINNAGDKVYDLTSGNPTLVKWTRLWPLNKLDVSLDSYMASPDMPYYNSYVYLGHGRMGHLPDYPWIKYQYSPEWSQGAIIKDNPSDFMKAFKQMVSALTSIRTGQAFNINTYADIGQENEAIINTVLNTKVSDQSPIWKNVISRIKVNNNPIEVPEDYDGNKWLNVMKSSGSKQQTDYYKFNFSAVAHVNLVRDSLKNSGIFLDQIPQQNIVRIKLQNSNSSFVGPFEQWVQYYPTVQKNSIDLDIIKPNGDPLCSGDIVKIRTTEKKAGQYNYLGAWSTEALYYYTRDYSISKQKWQILKISGSPGPRINDGDGIQLKNIFYHDKPYMCSYSWLLHGQYLTTIGNSNDSSTKWKVYIMENSNQYVNIVAKHSGKCIDVNGISLEDGAQIIQCQANGGDNQKFRLVDCGSGYFNIVAKHSGKCLDVRGGSSNDGAQIIQYHSNGGNNQKFKFVNCGDGYFNIVAKHSGKCIDVKGGNSDDGAQVIQYHSNGGNNQKFKFVPA